MFNDGSKYTGTLYNGVPDGLGTCVWRDGNQYDGEWKNGVMHGFGTYIWTSGQRYDGEWKVRPEARRMHARQRMHKARASVRTRVTHCARDGVHACDRNAVPQPVPGSGCCCVEQPIARPGGGRGYLSAWLRAMPTPASDAVRPMQEGRRDGVGNKLYADGSSFNGFWRDGQKHGVGVFRPPRPEGERKVRTLVATTRRTFVGRRARGSDGRQVPLPLCTCLRGGAGRVGASWWCRQLSPASVPAACPARLIGTYVGGRAHARPSRAHP